VTNEYPSEIRLRLDPEATNTSSLQVKMLSSPLKGPPDFTSTLQNKGTYGRAASGFCSSSLRRRVGRAVMISSHDKPSHEYNRPTSR
jgi:hypothetical protein